MDAYGKVCIICVYIKNSENCPDRRLGTWGLSRLPGPSWMCSARGFAETCKRHLIPVILGLSRASLGASLGALGGRRALQIRNFLLQSLVQDTLCTGLRFKL